MTTTAPSAYYDASQLRVDLWSRLGSRVRAMREEAGGASEAGAILSLLSEIEAYWAYPGRERVGRMLSLLESGLTVDLAAEVEGAVRRLSTGRYRQLDREGEGREEAERRSEANAFFAPRDRPYFEVLVADDGPEADREEFARQLAAARRREDEFVYEVVFVRSYEDAIIAALFNHGIQSVVVRSGIRLRTEAKHELLLRYLKDLPHRPCGRDEDRAEHLGGVLRELRPELDLFLITDSPVEDLAGQVGRSFRRVFYRLKDKMELHLSILKGISERFEAPFFEALRRYSRKPTGVFHALPVSRGKSISRSHWITDFGEFYGPNVFLAETSATTGGLDSLSQPAGPIKRAQELAARAFGAKRSYFVTNGTSTANKIVLQALCRPGDIVLASHDCHKSHHYAMILSGAEPIYMDPYPLSAYSMYGGVPLADILAQLEGLRAAGKLERARMLLLTNCTFDGITYDPLRVMREVLKVKRDMIFVWDEAWFAYARCTPTLRRRTAMWAAERLRREIAEGVGPAGARVRVYATQSTHKTLTSLRQGSMIHVYDQDFERLSADAFEEAYMTHTSTSPNYQIIASLDVGRRQVELEGYELVTRQVELAMAVRQRIHSHPLIQKYFRVVGAKDLIPPAHRPSGLEYYYDPESGWSRMEDAWEEDEFTVDPSRITVHVGRTGMDGDAFKKLLIDRYDIQINKTSRNTVLFMVHIGSTRSTAAYLIDVLASIARDIDAQVEEMGPAEREAFDARVVSLTEDLPPLPNFSRFHAAFRRGQTPEGDMRRAFFAATDESNVEHLRMDGTVARAMAGGREVVSAAFVTPYPPGFPVLVPGQVISSEILAYLKALDVREIHGYDARYGLRVFTEAALARLGSCGEG